MDKIRRITFARVLIILTVALALFFVCSISYNIGQFYQYLDAYSGDIVRGDQMAAIEGLYKLQYFYGLNNKLKAVGLDSMANKKLFKDAIYYETALDYLKGNYEQVLERLKDDDSYLAFYLKGNSKWYLAKGIFEHGWSMKDNKTRSETLAKATEMAKITKEDYEQAIRKDPNSTLPPKWNYDLVTDNSALMAALMPKPPKIKIVLGEGGKTKNGSGKDRGQGPKGEGTENLKFEGVETEGKPKPGFKRPG